MANTRKDHVALLAAAGIETPFVRIEIPNKVSKRMRSKIKKQRRTNNWDMLRIFHPARYIGLMAQLVHHK